MITIVLNYANVLPVLTFVVGLLYGILIGSN
jgi:hypothetical protein